MLTEMISVIIPVYNTAKYLSKCLDSIVNSDYNNLEIICINDGSTDDSLKILRDYEDKDDRIIVYDVQNCGVSQARNIGLDNATGEYICFIDSDDWVHKQFFSTLLYYAEKENAEITVGGFIRTKNYLEDKQFLNKEIKTSLYKKEELLEKNIIKSYIFGRIYNRCVIQEHRFVNELKMSEDKLFNIEIILDNKDINVVVLDIDLYYYYYRFDSAMNISSGIESKILSYILLECAENAVCKYCAGKYLDEAFKHTFVLRYMTSFIKDKEIKKEIKLLINYCLKLEKHIKPFSLKKSICFRIIAYFPRLYRRYRIINDPTMLDWEKKQKEKNK